jgi:tRNA(Ile)-lysidine synthase
VQRLADELPGATTARWPAPGGECRLYRGRLSFEPALPISVRAAQTVDLSTPGRHDFVAWGGAFVVRRCGEGGVGVERLRRATLAPRRGGESFQLAARAAARSLKKQYQARAVPAWQRGGPLVYDGDTLLFVPGLGHDARALAAVGTAQCRLHWEPAAAG